MPLRPGNSRKVISENIHELTHNGSRPRSHDQIVAIALHSADKTAHRDTGGMVPAHRDIGGILPTQTINDVTPQMQNARQAFQQMDPQRLQIMALKYSGTPQGQMAERILQQKRMMPTQPTAAITPAVAPTGMQPQMADGGPLKRAMGGMSLSQESPWWERSELRDSTEGFLHGPTLGRADAIKTTAPSGSYVIPADVVSGLGEGNSLAGARIMHEAMSSGPWGTALPAGRRGSGPPRAPAMRKDAKGGGVQGAGGPPDPVPVMLSHGEYVIPPETVRSIGRGNAKDGWSILDNFVMEMRKRHINKLKKLPPPAK